MHTLEESVDLSIEVWSWLAKTGKNKDDLPAETYDKIKGMAGNFPLCGYYSNTAPLQYSICGSCILYINAFYCLNPKHTFNMWQDYGFSCEDPRHPFRLWQDLRNAVQDSDIRLKKELARKIVDTLKRWKHEHTGRR